MRKTWVLLPAIAAVISMGFVAQPAVSQERSVKIAGFGARSGVVRSFGVNTEAVMRAAADQINKSGGVKLGDGSMGKIEISFDDDRCNAEEGISVLEEALVESVRQLGGQ